MYFYNYISLQDEHKMDKTVISQSVSQCDGLKRTPLSCT